MWLPDDRRGKQHLLCNKSHAIHLLFPFPSLYLATVFGNWSNVPPPEMYLQDQHPGGAVLCATMRKMRQWSSRDHSGNRLRWPKLWLSFGASENGHQACQSQAHGIPVPTLWQRMYWWFSFIKDFEFSSVVTSWVKLSWAVDQQAGIVLEDLQGKGHPPAPTFPTRYLHFRDCCRK